MKTNQSVLPAIEFDIPSLRLYGQAKLKKPSELRNIQSVFSVDYIPKKCRCQVFVQGNDVWVQHSDYFSPSMEVQEHGAPLSVLVKKYLEKSKANKFIYADAWGDIVLRSEAWIKITGLTSAIEAAERPAQLLRIWQDITRLQECHHGWDIYELEDSEMSRMWEAMVLKLHQQLKAQSDETNTTPE